MNQIISRNINEIKTLCQKHRVQSLYAFGSVVTASKFTKNSDIDFLVNFESDFLTGYASNYFSMSSELKNIFHRNIDLVTLRSLKNPYFIQSVNESKVLIYEQ